MNYDLTSQLLEILSLEKKQFLSNHRDSLASFHNVMFDEEPIKVLLLYYSISARYLNNVPKGHQDHGIILEPTNKK